jgi:poly-gamma-glutamate capsule biosynthesis protein CapA/YwtB (metallophosphatase superfamily)
VIFLSEIRNRCCLGIILLGLIACRLPAQDTLPQPDTARVRIIFCGDIMGHDSQISGAWDPETESYDYEPTFRYIKDYIIAADVAIGNLEVTLAGPPYKGYPAFSSPDELAIEARKAGFDVMVTANNHALDRGKKGFSRTLDILDSLEFFRAGSYRDSLERAGHHPLIFEVNGFRLALLNYTYGTNGLTIPPPFQINRIDTAIMRYELKKALDVRPDYSIVFIHWGNEYEREENKTQDDLAKFLLSNGADAVIGSHPHVVQPVKYMEYTRDSLRSGPVVFSLGNFVSNQRAQYKDGGIVAEVNLMKIDGNIFLESLDYLPYWVWRKDNPSGRSTFFVLPVALYEKYPENFDLLPGDVFRLERFAGDTRDHLRGAVESDFYK